MRKNESEAEYLGFVGTHTLKKWVVCPQHVWLIPPCIFLASPPGSSWRVYSFPTLKTFFTTTQMHKVFMCDLTQASLLCDSCSQLWSQLLEWHLALKSHHWNPILTFQSDHYPLTVWNTADYWYEAAGFCLQASEELLLVLLYKGVPLRGCIICLDAITQ